MTQPGSDDVLSEQAAVYYANPDVFVLMSFFVVSGKKAR